MDQFELNAQSRPGGGKGENRRLRRDGMVPAVVYGDKKDAVSLMLNHNDLVRQIENEAFYSHILTLNVDGASEQVVLRDMQRHPHKPIVMHLDFQRVSEDAKLHMQVPLHFINEDKCVGVKQHGGDISHLLADVEITCLPKDLPEYIEVDMTDIDIGDTIHMSGLKLPEGVEMPALAHGPEADQAVVSVHAARSTEHEEAEEAAAAAAAEGEAAAAEGAAEGEASGTEGGGEG